MKIEGIADLSVVTACLNPPKAISLCFDSVVNQTLKPLEHIVVDGASTNGSLEFLRKSQEAGLISSFISETDDGISEAFNKGIHLSRGKYVCFLNSDDRLAPDHFAFANSAMLDDFDIIVSDILFEGTPPRRLKPRYPELSKKPKWHPPQINHPGMIIKRSICESLGGYCLDFDVAMDVDFFYAALIAKASIWKTSEQTVFQSSKGKSRLSGVKPWTNYP